MGATVHKLPTALERGAHNAGEAKCCHCKHEWVAVAPVGTVWLECPKCETWHGLMKGPVYPDGAQWTCNCGCYVFVVSETTNILCAVCGTAHGQQFFSEGD
jgi:hypothetical protein